ncbi:MAG TPA: CaiB/BaiF CoA-transferase family protein [Gammaproteobacteria bacterium]|nr:CaiB/BaiF CoA-transferase family protein [Gammaproteobacteria bacterium]
MTTKHNSARRPLHGLRVIEAGQLLAGPFAGTILGYFGAEVIKVEPPRSGDPIRRWRKLKNGQSLWWSSLARNKKCVTLDLKSTRGRELMRALIDTADILVENFRPGTMEQWSLGPEEFKPTNPGLIYARISGYGQTGPSAPKPGFASVCEGFGGFRYVNGLPGEAPIRPNLSIGDTLAGIHAALGILLAYIDRSREEDGKGQVVDVAIFEAVFNLLEGVVPEYDGAGVVREPSGSTITGIVPSNTYRCGDGKLIVIGANTESMFKRLAKTMGQPEIGDDPKYSTNDNRVEHQDEIDGRIAAWAGSFPAAEALARLEDAGVAAGPIYSVEDIFNDPQYEARGLLQRVTVNGEPLTIPALVPRLSETPGSTDWPGPAVGSHNDEVFSQILRLSEDEQSELRENGVI